MPSSQPQQPKEPRKQPKPPFPEQHLDGTGAEVELEPRPRYQAEAYRPAGKLEGGDDPGPRAGRAPAVRSGLTHPTGVPLSLDTTGVISRCSTCSP